MANLRQCLVCDNLFESKSDSQSCPTCDEMLNVSLEIQDELRNEQPIPQATNNENNEQPIPQATNNENNEQCHSNTTETRHIRLGTIRQMRENQNVKCCDLMIRAYNYGIADQNGQIFHISCGFFQQRFDELKLDHTSFINYTKTKHNYVIQAVRSYFKNIKSSDDLN